MVTRKPPGQTSGSIRDSDESAEIVYDRPMEIFLDTASISEIVRWKQQRIIDGITTNPSILFQAGYHDLESAARELARVMDGLPVSVEVTTDDPEEMVRQGREYARWAPNIVVKIPVLNTTGEPCFAVIARLQGEGIRVNCTAILSFGQAMLAAKAGATYLSVFAGRMGDEGNDPFPIVESLRQWLDRWQSPAKVLVGSIRQPLDVQKAACAGAHVVTIPPALLAKLADHRYSRATAAEFLENAKKSEAAASKALAGTRG